MAYLIPTLIIAILIILNGIFVAAEFAIITTPKTRITQIAEEGNLSARLVLTTLISNEAQNRYITTAQVGITIVSLGLGMYGEHTLAEWILELFHGVEWLNESTTHTVSTLLAIGGLTYLHVVIGEMIPKSLSLQSAEKVSLFLAVPMLIMEKVFSPFVWLLTILGDFTMRLFRIPISEEGSKLFTSAEIEYLVEESMEQGLLESSDHLFIDNIFDLEERTVEQAMTPRNKFIAIPSTSNWEETTRIVCDTNKTRYPVYEDNLDHVIGVIHIKDLARVAANPTSTSSFILKDIVRPISFVPDTLKLSEILIKFRLESGQIAVAIDEYGGTAGLITLEDIVEEVVGEIQDEFDEEERPIIQLSETKIRVQGDVILDELEQLYTLGITHEEANTIGGYIMAELGRIPKQGDQVITEGITITVDQLEGRAVQWATIVYQPAN